MTDTHALGSIEPVAWQLQRTSDGTWISVSVEEKEYHAGHGRTVRPLYALPADYLERVRAIKAEIARLREALTFYADPVNYIDAVWEADSNTPNAIPATCEEGSWVCDCGDIARAVLLPKTEEAKPRHKRWASELTDDELAAELAEVEARIANGFGEHGGSPGEWYYERADEIDSEMKRRAALSNREDGE